jgi:hypothetical protein
MNLDGSKLTIWSGVMQKGKLYQTTRTCVLFKDNYSLKDIGNLEKALLC